MKPQLTLQTPLELPSEEISNYLNKLWISEGEDNAGANTFSLIVWQPSWLEQKLVKSNLINGPITGHLRYFISISNSQSILNASLACSIDPLWEPLAKAIDLRGSFILEEAPLLTNGIAWNGFKADLIKLLYSGLPAHIKTLPFLSQTTA